MSELKRFFLENSELAVGGIAVLCGEEFEHAKNVLRLGVGAEVVLLDNSGKEFTAVVVGVEKRQMSLSVLREDLGEREANTEIALAFGYLKNADKNEFIVQKAVELGVKKIVAFSSEFSSAFMNENKLERLNKVSREAAKQCLRSVAPRVEYCGDLAAALESLDGFENKLFACEFAAESKADISSLRGSCAVVVGSEGGFSRAEEALANEKGFASITLGKRILRAETAAVALVALTAFAVGELG